MSQQHLESSNEKLQKKVTSLRKKLETEEDLLSRMRDEASEKAFQVDHLLQQNEQLQTKMKSLEETYSRQVLEQENALKQLSEHFHNTKTEVGQAPSFNFFLRFVCSACAVVCGCVGWCIFGRVCLGWLGELNSFFYFFY